MKATAEKSSTTTSATATQAVRQPFFVKAGAGGFFEPVPRAGMSGIQFKMNVGQPGDKFEREADRMADKVMRMPASASPVKEEKLQRQADDTLQKKEEEKIQKAPAAEEKLQRKGDGTPTINAGTQSAIQNLSSGGQPLAPDVRSYMEPRFGADFSKVRIHSDPEAASLSNQLSARAFTYQNHVFFSGNQYQPGTSEGKQLLAHELTHTIQQGHSVQRSPQVTTTVTPPHIQRSATGEILDWFADNANYIPGFRMLTIVLGFNPINMRSTDRSAANILRALIELVPGGHFITQALDNHGVFNKAGAWIEQKLAALGHIGSDIVAGLKRFIDSLGVADLAPWNWGGVWDRAKRIFTDPIARLISFAGSVVSEILKIVKDAILKPLAALAQGTRGYDLLKAILGEDPITGEPVPRNADTLIGGFMKLIGQEEIWNNIKKGNAVARAWTWFQGALSGLMGLVRAVPRKIVATFSSLTFMDIITVVGVFGKIVGAFANIAIDFISWGLSTTWSLLEIIFDVVKPGIMVYIKKTGAALKSIIKNPLPFVGNLVRAAKTGFQNFADNFGGHLKAGLIDWLTGSLSGVYIPKALSLPEMGKFAMSVLGITWAQIRGKIVKVLGPNGETIMKGLETGFDIVVALVTGGPAAAWELIKEKLTDLKDQVVSGIIGFVTNTVITKAVPKLISMFIPGAGFISAIISIYDTVMVFVEKISKIIQVVVAFIDSIVTIAAGNITAAAKRVESILGGLLSLAISFLAGFLGLGKVTDKIMGVIEKVRASVDKAIDAVINWIVTKAKALFGKAKSAVSNWWKAKKPFKTKGGEDHTIFFTGEEKNVIPMVASKDPKPIANKLDEISTLANTLDNAAKKKNALALINQTRSTLKQNPDDPLIVSNMSDLFEIFDSAGTPKKYDYKQEEQTLPGDDTNTAVGKSMRIDWLGSSFIKDHKGSKPGSGQDKLMKKLVTSPWKANEYKYIRGHLLNHNLGGKGENRNLFPITANANKNHLLSAEGDIKNWVERKDKYALYEVNVILKSVKLNGNKGQNFVNSIFNCRIVLKDASGKEDKNYLTSIESEYKEEHTAERFDLTDTKPPSTKK